MYTCELCSYTWTNEENMENSKFYPYRCPKCRPKYIQDRERSKREDFDKIVKKAIDKAYEPEGIYDKCITHYQNAEIDVLFKDAVL